MNHSGPNTDEEALFNALGQRQDVINTALTDVFDTREDTPLYDAAYHLLDAGGKRIRPAMSLLVAEALTETPSEEIDYEAVIDKAGNQIDVLSGAVSVEILHSFTLVHDDIMDDDAMRRGVPAVHEAFGEDMAILSGDTLYAEAFQALLASGAPPDRCLQAMELLVDTATKVCQGQAEDIEFESRDDVTPEEYMEMITMKTAVLFGASAAIPAILLGESEETVDALYQYGLDVGRAFQIQDDVIDLTTPSEELGKQRGSDLVEEKKTIITLHAKQNGVNVDTLVSAESAEDVDEAEIDSAVRELENAGSIEYAQNRATEYVDRGTEQLAVVPETTEQQLLVDLAEYLVSRTY